MVTASSKTMKGALPPSSMLHFLTCGAHCPSSSAPTAVEPVKESFRTVGLEVSSPPTSGASPVTTLSTPGGMPARSPSSASASAEKGVSSEGLMSMEQPAPSAAPALRVIMALGKFHGVMAAVTPIGCRSTWMRLSGRCPGIVSPYVRLASSANHSMKEAP